MDGGERTPSVGPMTTPTAMPASFSAGTTLTYERTVPDLPSSSYGWKLSVYLAGPAEAKHEAITLTNGVGTVLIAATATADMPAGAYRWLERITENSPGTRVFDVGAGSLEIGPNLATAAEGSALSYEAQVLAALQAKLLGRLGTDQETLQVEGTAIARIPFDQLERLVAKYQAIVDLQRSPNAAIGSVEITFGRPQ